MSGVNNITLSYQEYKSYIRNNKESRLADRSYSMDLVNGQSDEKLLGSAVYRNAETGDKCELKAAYDDDFTSDSPLIKVMVDGIGQKKQEYIINIDEIDVSAASDIEMFALCNYIDAHEKRAGNTRTSWDALKTYVDDKLRESSSDQTGLESVEQKRDWLTMVEEEKDSNMETMLYDQVADGNRLIHMLEKYGMPKEVEMMRIGDNLLVPVDNGMRIQDLDGGYAQMIFGSNGEISYVNNLNREANWNIEVPHEMFKKAKQLGPEFAVFMSDKGFWESYLNGDMDIEALREAIDYKAIRSDFYEYLPESVKQAWDKAVEESGIDGLGISANGELQYPSEFMRRYMTAILKGESTKICGDTTESVLEFARTALSHLQDKYQPKYNAATQAFKNKEVLFYQNLMNNLM